MADWTLENAKNQFSEVVRRALAHEPQLVTRGRRDAVIVVARDDFERLIASQSLVEFMRHSPLAAAIAVGELDVDQLARRDDMGRDVAF